jgi:hypothetical protein
MEGGFFLIQHVDLGQQDGQRIKGLEVIGYERPFGAEPSEEIKSRFYSDTGDTIDYVYELEGETLTIWAGERGSPACYTGTFSDDGDTLSGAWHYPGAAVSRRSQLGSANRHPRRRFADLSRHRNLGVRPGSAGRHERRTWSAKSISILGPSPGP